MSEQSESRSTNSTNSFLAFMVGGLVVAVGVLAWVLYGDGGLGGSDDLTISIEGGAAAAEAIEVAVTGSE